MIYSRALREAKRRENDKYFLNAKNKSKAVWQVINKGIGKTPLNKHDITINWNSVEITHPKNVAELFNSYFSRIPEKLLKKQGDSRINPQSHHFKIKESIKTMFLFPVTENEVENVAKGLKKKSSAGIDGIPDCIVKQCIQLLKKPLTNIYNASFDSGIFPDQLKIANIIPLHKKGELRLCDVS
jgi:hypothetical protein